tara:strand:+ start:241 stop:528 length:288 start_codon:yes stop_codon:yes gene_type:complete
MSKVMARLEDVLTDIQTQKNKNIREVQESYVRKFGATYYSDILCFAIFNNDNAFDDSSIERSYIKLTQRAIEKNKRLSPEEITSVVFQIPTDATE